MERLTHKRVSGIRAGYWSPNKKQELVDRLAGYEDTGLDPEQIRELKERDTAKAPVQYGDEDEPVLRCPHCDEDVTDLTECGFNFCPYCGQKLK